MAPVTVARRTSSGGNLYRPDDRDALQSALREARRDAGMSVAFGGEVRDSGPCASVTLTDLIGTRTGHLRNLRVLAGTGLGGRVMVDSRPAGVEDYGVARGITHDYDLPVLAEGLCTVVAAPVVVAGRP